jgi:drug/metabolite transporter (DMT)-like permease
LFVAAIAYFLLKEPYTGVNLVASIGAFIGVGIYSFGKDYYPLDSYYPVLFVSISTVSFTIELILTRIMNKYLHPIHAPFYYSLFLFII